MNEFNTRNSGGHDFVIGLLAGTIVGAGLMMWLVPKATSELRQRLSHSATTLGERATELGERAADRYQQANAQVGDAVSELTRKGQHVRDDVADAVVRGAQNVERIAVAAKTSSRQL